MAKIRNLDEVRADIAAIEAEIKALQEKAATEEGLTPEEASKLEELVSQLEAAKTEEVAADAEARYQKIKSQDENVKRSLPVYVKSSAKSDEYKFGRGIGAWLSASRTPADVEKIRSSGFDPNSKFAHVPFDARKINFKNRTVLSTGGSGTGSEWASYKTYSDQVFEYLTYENPLLGFVNTESMNNGRERYYFDVDDTSMIATDITASSGTEIAKTIPETNLVSGRKEIQVKTITSGYQKVTMEMLQDSPFSLEDKIAKASSKALARKMDSDLVLATGNGVTNVEGLSAIATALPDVSEWSIDNIEELVDAVPDYYRNGCIFLSNSATKSAIRRALKDTTGRTLFERADVGNLRFESLFDYTWVVSAYMADDEVIFFNPSHYTLVVVNNQIFQRFDEKFFDQVAWAGLLRFGGARTGDADAFAKLSLDAGS